MATLGKAIDVLQPAWAKDVKQICTTTEHNIPAGLLLLGVLELAMRKLY
jgi:hypothetical protein